ncbi:MAG: carboxylating nicotinate-nucleotide diphosphorylase [Phycisphaeraceae bacterium]|nr:carboxylating nicotinate-nucleotide diphosphorylase [Phycisphaeraceae bacterium]
MAVTESQSRVSDFIDTPDLERLIDAALMEDLGPTRLDLTSRGLVPHRLQASADLVARQAGIIAGLALIPEILPRFSAKLDFEPALGDGAHVEPKTALGRLTGPADDLLAAERTVLNFLTHLSGIATLARRCVEETQGTGASICDTRKTIPGLRGLARYAASLGGVISHRTGLYDAVLVKDNHLLCIGGCAGEWSGRLGQAIARWRAGDPAPTFIQVEVDTLDQLRAILALPVEQRPDMVLLDNMSLEQSRQAVALAAEVRPRVLMEASGGIQPGRIRPVAETGVDRISIGAITHSAPAMDIGLDFAPLAGSE